MCDKSNHAFKAHPDKGGSEYLFNMVTECYKYLAKELKKKESDKLHYELKKESEKTRYTTSTTETNSIQQLFYKGSHFDQQKFNKFFDDNKFKEDAHEIGYKEWMAKNNVTTTPQFKGGGISMFNEHFDKNVKIDKQQQLIKWQEPQPIIASNKLLFSELGKPAVDDFSGENRSIKELNYMDYKVAHTTSRIIDPSSVKRKDFASIQELEKHRANVPYQMTNKEARDYAKKMNELKTKETKRKEYMTIYDQELAQHYQKVNNLLGFSQRV
jgi:hypothetical protein